MLTRSIAQATAAAPAPPVIGDPVTFAAFCFNTDAIGDFVYIMGPKVGSTFQVTKMDIDAVLVRPFVGILTSKSAATDCIVQASGIVQGLYASMTPGVLQIASTIARPTESLARPTSGTRLHQPCGLALSGEDILIQPMQPVLLRA